MKFVSKNFPDYAIGVDNCQWAKIVKKTGILQHFKLTRGLCGDAGTVSFESVNSPGHFLKQTKNTWLKLTEQKTTEDYKKATSFKPIMGLFHDVRCLKFIMILFFKINFDFFFYVIFSQGFVSFESVSLLGYLIRHADYRLGVHKGSGDVYEDNASFSISKKYI